MVNQSRTNASRGELVVEAVGLTKVFHDFWHRSTAVAVDGIDFHIRRNEIFGLLGPNGSGKSTTIKMILGLLRRTRGVLKVFGREPDDVAVKRRIGFLPEESYLYRFLNPVETLDYYGKLFGLARRIRRQRSEELLRMVGLDAAAHRTVGEFSKGMARRLGLAQALINDPDFLILDEPTSGLDPIGTRQVKDLLLDLGRRGKTILLSSHLLSDVEDVCDRMVILYGGRIRAEGTTDELLEDTGRTVIQTPRLRAETISRVEEVIREREGAAIERVHSPRQRLEELFMGIVEQARREQIATSGAVSGGATADFLLHGDEASSDRVEGGALISSLASAQADRPLRAVEVDGARPGAREARVRDEVLRELVKPGGESPPDRVSEPPAASPPGAPERPTPGARAEVADVDRSLIEGLLGRDDPRRGADDRGGGG